MILRLQQRNYRRSDQEDAMHDFSTKSEQHIALGSNLQFLGSNLYWNTQNDSKDVAVLVDETLHVP